MPCSLCGGNLFNTVSERDRHGNPLRTVVCKGCGIITNDPIPSDDDLAAFYKSNYRVSYKGAEIPRKRQVFRNFKRLEQHFRENRGFYKPGLTGLDLGSGSGEFLFLARSLGLNFVGLEPNKGYADYTTEMLGLPVETRLLEEASYPAAHFDFIRLSHVLEHMRDPVRSLEALKKWLKPDGIMYIEVPQIDAEAQRKLRGRMFHFGHIYNFDPFTLRLAAGLGGFSEHPDAVARFSGTTGTFFRVHTPKQPSDKEKTANAARNTALMEAHNASAMPTPSETTAVKRFFEINRLRLSEQLAASRFSTHRAIADHFAQRIAGT